MIVRSLEHLDLAEIARAFNTAFADYIVPVTLDVKQLQRKMIAENIDLTWSPGIFDGDRLVGLILNGPDEWKGKKALYNGGTGIAPDHRGKGLVGRLYESIMPRLLREGFDHCLLEVITSNVPAIRAYEKTGFRQVRELACFRGKAPQVDERQFREVRIRSLQLDQHPELDAYWRFEPTWQHNLATMNRSADAVSAFGLFRDKDLLGYGILDPQGGRIKQFAVHPDHRGRGLGRLLFHHFGRLYKSVLTVINVDVRDERTMRFFLELGFEPYLYQYEMKLDLRHIVT